MLGLFQTAALRPCLNLIVNYKIDVRSAMSEIKVQLDGKSILPKIIHQVVLDPSAPSEISQNVAN